MRAVMDDRTTASLSSRAFDEAVTRDASIDTKVLARLLGLPLSTLAPAFGVSTRTLEINQVAPKAQDRARQLVAALNKLALNLSDRRYAIMWLKSPYKPFAGKMPADWLEDGDLDGVCDEIERIVANQPD